MTINPELASAIALHVADKAMAVKLIDALELVVDAANSHCEDLQTGVEQGIYDSNENVTEIEALVAAITLVEEG